MAKDLYFLRLIADALQQADPKPAVERAFKEIIELGQQPEYDQGFRQFKQFMGVMTDNLDADLNKTEHIQLYTGLTDDDENEIASLVDFIRSHPGSRERFDQIYQKISIPDIHSFQLEITINRNGKSVCSIPVGDGLLLTKIKDLMPGLYDVKLNTGRILWQGELTDRDFFWTTAFPETDMAMAADTGDTTDHVTKEIRLLAGGLIIRVIPELESGCIEMEIRI